MVQVGWMAAAVASALAFFCAEGVPAQPAPISSNLSAPAADPAFEAAMAAFEALPEAERKAVQDALVWTGDYNSVITGTFGRRTFEALAAYQRRAKLNPAGILDGETRADLQAAAQRAREAVKFAVVADPKTGARIGVPERLLPKARPESERRDALAERRREDHARHARRPDRRGRSGLPLRT